MHLIARLLKDLSQDFKVNSLGRRHHDIDDMWNPFSNTLRFSATTIENGFSACITQIMSPHFTLISWIFFIFAVLLLFN